MTRRALSLLLVLALSPLSAAAQESALEGLRAAARAAPRDYDAQLALGRALLEAGRYREAAAQLRRAAGLRRGDAAALYEVARVDFEQHEHQRARAQCRAVARAAQGTPLGRVCQARAFLAWNRSARAFEELEAALEQAPNDFEALLALGDAHRLRAAVPEAEDAYRRAIAADGRRAEPHLGLGQLYAQASRRQEAVAALRRAHELAPDDPDVDYELGRALSGEDAVRHLREAVQNRPTWALAHAGLGDALLALGQHEMSRAVRFPVSSYHPLLTRPGYMTPLSALLLRRQFHLIQESSRFLLYQNLLYPPDAASPRKKRALSVLQKSSSSDLHFHQKPAGRYGMLSLKVHIYCRIYSAGFCPQSHPESPKMDQMKSQNLYLLPVLNLISSPPSEELSRKDRSLS